MGLLECFYIGSSLSRGLLVSHLLFADDTLIFWRPCESDLGFLRWVLLLFEGMSGLRVNLSKCSLILIGEIPNIYHLASFFDCGVSALPSTYLGLPLGASFKSKAWGPCSGELSNKTCRVEVKDVVQRSKANSLAEHSLESPNLLHVFIHNSGEHC